MYTINYMRRNFVFKYGKVLLSSFVVLIIVFQATFLNKFTQLLHKKDNLNINDKDKSTDLACPDKKAEENKFLLVDCTGFFE